MTLPRLSLVLALVGVALAAGGVLVGPARFTGVEGAFFTRAAGNPALHSAFDSSGDGLALLSPRDGNLWLGGGIACLLLAGGALLAHARGLRLVRVGAT